MKKLALFVERVSLKLSPIGFVSTIHKHHRRKKRKFAGKVEKNKKKGERFGIFFGGEKEEEEEEKEENRICEFVIFYETRDEERRLRGYLNERLSA